MSRLLLIGLMVLTFAAALSIGTEAASYHEVRKLVASDGQAGDEFGLSVAVSGGTAVVGAAASGAAYIFERNEGGVNNWGELTRLAGSDVEAGDDFGFSVAISGDVAVVGANVADAGAVNTGAAYIFERHIGGPDGWGEVAQLVASDRQHGDWFGSSVAVSEDTVVVGAYRAGEDDAGAAYVFQRNSGGPDNWGQVTKLTSSDIEPGDWFGDRVAVSGDTALVGVSLEDAGVGFAAGAVYVFRRDEGGLDNWGEVSKLVASDAQEGDQFGISVAVDGDFAIVGACCKDDPAVDAGAVYVFERHEGGLENWGEVKKLTASDGRAGDRFGESVAISGSITVVGAGSEWVSGVRPGAAYVFARDEGSLGSWGKAKRLTASDAEAGDYFGKSVAATGDIAVVGAYRESTAGTDAGAAYVFERGAEVPTPTPTPTPSVPGDVGCDGTTNAIDAALLLQLTAGLVDSLDCEGNGDMNGDDSLNAIDATLILQFVAGLLLTLPAM